MKNGKSKVKKIREDLTFDIINYAFNALLLIVSLYPIYFILIASFSNPGYVYGGEVWLIPKGFNIEGYKSLFEYKPIWTGYANSLFYAVIGTIINLIITIPAGYALSRKDLVGRDAVMVFFTITMFFSGGLIPTFLVVKNLGLYNTFWIMVIINAASVYNIILCRTFFSSTIPMEMWEAASIDGCRNTIFFFKIVLPLSTAIVAVMALFYSVAHWNSYMTAIIYLSNRELYPLQLILREILIINKTDTDLLDTQAGIKQMEDLIKFTSIIVASAPMLALYPFIQKYFVKGVMIGSIKG